MSIITRLTKSQRLRSELAHLRARYDCGAVAPEIYGVIRGLESGASVARASRAL